MTPNHRHPREPLRDEELEAWLERVVGTRNPDPAPVVHDLDE